MAYVDTSIHTFQNSLKGLIQLNYGVTGCSLQFTPVFKPISPKDIQPGMKIYNYQESRFFTLDISESMALAHILEEILTIMRLMKLGQYQGPVVPNYLAQQGQISVDANKQSISIVHYPKQGMSIVSLIADSKNPFVWYFNYNLIQNKQSVFSVSLAIKDHDLYLLKEYFKGIINYKATYAANHRSQYDQTRNNDNGNRSYNNNNNNNYNNSNNYNNNSSNYNNNNSSYGNNYGNYQQSQSQTTQQSTQPTDLANLIS